MMIVICEDADLDLDCTTDVDGDSDSVICGTACGSKYTEPQAEAMKKSKASSAIHCHLCLEA